MKRIAAQWAVAPQHSPLVATTSAPESHMLVARMVPTAIGSCGERRRIASAAAGIRSLGIGAVVFTLRGSSAPGTGTVKVSARTGDTASWRANSVPRRQLLPRHMDDGVSLVQAGFQGAAQRALHARKLQSRQRPSLPHSRVSPNNIAQIFRNAISTRIRSLAFLNIREPPHAKGFQ